MRDGGYEEIGNFLEFSKNGSEQRRTAAGTCPTETKWGPHKNLWVTNSHILTNIYQFQT